MAVRTKVVAPLVVWTLIVWSSRIRNIWTDADLTLGGQVLRTGFAAVFLGFGVAVAVRLWQTRNGGWGAADRRLLGLFLAWTVGFWLVRGIGIIVDDHELGFTVVHTALMVVSIGLAGLAARAISGRSISSSIAAAR